MSAHRIPKMPLLSAAAFAVAVLAVMAGAVLRVSYYLTSVLVIVCAMVPLFASFECSRPQARELALLAVMCALAVASRVAFVWVPHFKPMAGIVMITGIALGARAGFMAGSLSAFASGFFFGQGPWTPWQMLAFGIGGLAAGWVADRGLVARVRLSVRENVALAIGSGLFVLAVLGPVLDTCSLFLMVSVITLESALAIYAAGVPVNAIHAAATTITLLLLANPLLGRIARVRAKYGLD